LRGRRAGLIGDADDERGTAAIDHGIGELRGDDLAPQSMVLDRIGVSATAGEIAAELAAEIGSSGTPIDELMVDGLA
jgi:hypothetical protein